MRSQTLHSSALLHLPLLHLGKYSIVAFRYMLTLNQRMRWRAAGKRLDQRLLKALVGNQQETLLREWACEQDHNLLDDPQLLEEVVAWMMSLRSSLFEDLAYKYIRLRERNTLRHLEIHAAARAFNDEFLLALSEV